MKKVLIIIAVIVAVGAGVYAYRNTQSASTPAAATPGATGTLSDMTTLLAGTLKLEDTDQAVTAEQAPELLALWKAYSTLSADDTTTGAELTALVTQIGDTMTGEQTAAIDAMHLTSEDVAALMQAQGLQIGGGGAAPAADASAAGSGGAMPSGAGLEGGAPSGGMPGMDMGGQMGAATSGATGSDAAAGLASSGAQDPMATAMLQAVVDLLSAKVA